jgi:hypothetical protein
MQIFCIIPSATRLPTVKPSSAPLALAPQHNGSSLSNGALMRASPLAVWAHRLPAAAVAAAARQEAALTHPNPIAQVPLCMGGGRFHRGGRLTYYSGRGPLCCKGGGWIWLGRRARIARCSLTI